MLSVAVVAADSRISPTTGLRKNLACPLLAVTPCMPILHSALVDIRSEETVSHERTVTGDMEWRWRSSRCDDDGHWRIQRAQHLAASVYATITSEARAMIESADMVNSLMVIVRKVAEPYDCLQGGAHRAQK